MRRVAIILACCASSACVVATPIGSLEEDEVVAATTTTTTPSPNTTTDGPPPTVTTDMPTTDMTGGPVDTETTGLDSGSATTDPTEGAGPPEMVSYGILFSDLPDGKPGKTTGGTSSGGIDPDTVLVNVGFNTGSCEDPFYGDICNTWEASFSLDLDQQVPGNYDGSVVNLSYSENLDEQGDGTCGAGFGTLEATVVIDSFDEMSIVGSIINVVDEPIENVTLEGLQFTAIRC